MRRLVLLTSIALVSACTAAPAPQQVNKPSQAPSAPSQNAPAPARNPPGSPGASANAPSAPLDGKVAEAKAAYDKNPGDAGVKKDYVEATFQNAQFYMYNSPLPPNQKYPKALALYRQVLALEPDNAEAKDAIKMIEDIYASLGKPIPQG